MPKPAPVSFDAHDRQTLRTSVLVATGPALASLILIIGASLSAQPCQHDNRPWIAGLIICALAVSVSATVLLRRSWRRMEGADKFLAWLGIALDAYSICVLLAFAVALWTEVRCE